MRKALHCMAVLLLACYAATLLGVPSAHALSQDEEIRISSQFRREARRRLKFIEDPEVELYVARIGRRILDAVGNTRYPYRFFVIEDSSMNAFAVPGGRVFVTSGLIDAIENEAALKAILAHEVAHVKSRYSYRVAPGREAGRAIGGLPSARHPPHAD